MKYTIGYTLKLLMIFIYTSVYQVKLYGDDSEKLLKLVRNGNDAAIQSIEKFYAHFELRPLENILNEDLKAKFEVDSPSGEYWRSQNCIHIEMKPKYLGKKNREIYIKDGKSHVINTFEGSGKKAITYSIEQFEFLPRGNVWEFGLFEHTVMDGTRIRELSFSEILAQQPIIHSVKWEKSEEAKVIRVDLSVQKCRIILDFDPNYNFLIRRRVLDPPKGPSYRHIWEIKQFFEATPGIFVPQLIEHRYISKDAIDEVIELSNIKINRSVSDKNLEIKLPRGITCENLIDRNKYKVDEKGYPISEKTSLMPVSATVNFNNQGLIPLNQGNNNGSNYLFYLVITVIIILTIFIYLRRKRLKYTSKKI